MLERLAAWFLNTYVAEYVGNVVTDQLSIGLLKGKGENRKAYTNVYLLSLPSTKGTWATTLHVL